MFVSIFRRFLAGKWAWPAPLGFGAQVPAKKFAHAGVLSGRKLSQNRLPKISDPGSPLLTIHGIISLNTLIFLHKARNFSTSLPASIVNIISRNSPVSGSTHETCTEWLIKYDNHIYRNSVFYKGPLLVLSSNIEQNLSPASFFKH